MNINIDFVLVGKTKNGLTNQLYPIVNAIIDKIISKNTPYTFNILFLSSFCKDALQNQSDIFCPVREILDLDYMNNYLKQYNIMLISQEDIQLELIKIEYGLRNISVIDVTEVLKPYCIRDKRLIINDTIELNNICGDPLPNIKKILYIKYKVNRFDFQIEIDEFCGKVNQTVDIDFNNVDNKYNSTYLNTLTQQAKNNQHLVKEILNNLTFTDFLNNTTISVVDSIKKSYNTINVLHMRNEDDAIEFFSRINNMDQNIFKNVLIDKYISLIQKYIVAKENSVIIILSGNPTGPVIDYLIENKYNYYVMNKTIFNHREINAIIDLLIGKTCNNVFIGNYNPHTLYGSTFSHLLSCIISNSCKKVSIDLDNIKDPEYIIY